MKKIQKQALSFATEWGKLKAIVPSEIKKRMDAIEKKDINKLLRNLQNLKRENS